jgi:acyl carrier protein
MATDNGPVLPVREVEDRIIAFMRRELLSPDVTVEREDDLLSGDLLDSVAVLRLAAFVEEEFHFVIQPADFVIENFQNVAVLAGYVQRATGR